MSLSNDGKVLVFAPFSRDADSISQTLAAHRIGSETVGTLTSLADRLGDDVGAVLLTEEALLQPSWHVLIDAIHSQPSWSSYPFIVIVGQKRFRTPDVVFAVLPAEVTNAVILERPMGSATLLSTVRWALAGRRRQFATRDHLKQLEDNARQQALLTRELAHRVKNTIAILQSIVLQTMRSRPEVDELRQQIIERFSALARAHDLLLRTDFAAADFRELVVDATNVHGERLLIEGPAIDLSPQASLSLALVLHELGTNAVKYGSLRANDGWVKVSWGITEGAFNFRWSEVGTEAISPPSREGFGSRLIRATLEGLGDVGLSYEPKGFQLDFSADLDRLQYGIVDAS